VEQIIGRLTAAHIAVGVVGDGDGDGIVDAVDDAADRLAGIAHGQHAVQRVVGRRLVLGQLGGRARVVVARIGVDVVAVLERLVAVLVIGVVGQNRVVLPDVVTLIALVSLQRVVD